jgi:acyl-coenzyme A thioesterase PaaI-like protein
MHLSAPPVGRLIGFALKSIEPGHAVFEVGPGERHHNPMGTLKLKINFFLAIWKATLTAEARVVKAGNTLGYVESEVKDQDGRLVAKTTSTCMKLRQPQGDILLASSGAFTPAQATAPADRSRGYRQRPQ